jgi:hypothetical protein
MKIHHAYIHTHPQAVRNRAWLHTCMAHTLYTHMSTHALRSKTIHVCYHSHIFAHSAIILTYSHIFAHSAIIHTYSHTVLSITHIRTQCYHPHIFAYIRTQCYHSHIFAYSAIILTYSHTETNHKCVCIHKCAHVDVCIPPYRWF